MVPLHLKWEVLHTLLKPGKGRSSPMSNGAHKL